MGVVEYYRPLLSMLGSLLYAVAGSERPWAWHLANVLLHVATAAGVFQLLRRWAAAPASHAAAGATLFALWPAAIEAVSWVSACSELLMGAFVVWGLVLHLHARDRGAVAIGAAVLHLCALLSKEVGAVFLPLSLAATALVPAAPDATSDSRVSRGLKLFGPHVAVFLAYGFLRAQAVGSGSSLTALALDRLRPEALGPALYAWGWYVREGLLLGSGSPYVESPAASALTWAFALGGLFLFARALDVSRRPGGRAFGLAGIWFVIALGPPLAFASAPISITPVAGRYLYLPIVALCALFTLALPRVLAVVRAPRTRAIAAGAAACALLALGWARQSPWLSDRALWNRAVADNPHSSIAKLNLGLAEIVAGDIAQGEEHLRMAAWNPALADGPARQGMLVRVGEYYIQAGKPDLAEEALVLAARMPGFPAIATRARASAMALRLLGNGEAISRDEAKRQIAVLESAAALDSRDTTSRLMLALLEEALGEPVRALARYEDIARVSAARPDRRDAALASAARLSASVAQDPDPVRRRYHEAQLHELRGDAAAAIAAYREVLAAGPDRPEIRLALSSLLSRTGQGAEAIRELEAASRLVPGDPSVWYNLGIEQQKSADFSAAAVSFGHAIEIAPEWWKPYVPRGLALESAGNLAEAAATYETFLARFDEPADVRVEVARRLQRIRASAR